MERHSFAGIERKVHPLCGDYLNGVFDNREKTDPYDEIIISEIIEVYRENHDKAALASGEWTWIQNNKQRAYKQLLMEGNKEALISMFRNFFRNQISYGISAPDSEDAETAQKLVNDTLLDIDTWIEFCPGLPISELNSLPVGNPFGVVMGGTLVMYNSCRHYYHAAKLKALTQVIEHPVIFEIGAGYGGVYYFLSQIMKKGFCYIVCDLMETLFTNFYYTRKWTHSAGKNLRIKWAIDGIITTQDIADYNLILVPSVSHGSIRAGFDAAYNANSFSEMAYGDISGYFDTIDQNKAKYIFHQNSNYSLWNTSSRGHIEILAQDFPIPSEYSLVYQAVSPWTGAGGRYREYLYERK